MKSKHCSIRLAGQRSITSSFLLGSSNRTVDCKEDVQNNAIEKGSRVSLSDFLNRRLQKSSGLPKSVQGKERPFSSPLFGGKLNGSTEQRKDILDVAFEQLNQDIKENDDPIVSSVNGELGNLSNNGVQESRKRKSSFEGEKGSQSSRKRLVVLGDDPKPKNNSKWKSFITEEKPKRHYNHYANGSGFWDSNMEGVDSEEVGCNQMWEGVGSTTIGGLEWH